MVINLQFFGGRGSSGGLGGSNIKLSPTMARVYYNSAKKDTNFAVRETRDNNIERAIRSGDANYIERIHTEQEARRVKEYLIERSAEVNKKIVALGSPEKLQKSPKIVTERRNITSLSVAATEKMKEFSKKEEPGNTNIHDLSRVTTTYERARKRRMRNFDAWFHGGKK